MKKNGYLRKFIAMFLVFVMLMADSSMTTFASSFTVGRVKQQNADEGVAVQSSNDVNVTVNAPDGTYYVAIMKDNDIKSKVAQVTVSGGSATATVQPRQADWNISDGQVVMLKLKQGSYSENYDQNNYIIQKNGEILRTDDGKVLKITATANSITLTQQTINAGTTRSFKDILGSSTNFGIVANEATFRGHLESNFAIGKLYYRGSNVQMSKNVNGGAGYNYIGEFDGNQTLQIGLNGNTGGSVVYAGKGVKDKLTSAQGEDDFLVFDYDTYSESQIKQMVRDMVGEIAKTSTTLYNEKNTVDYDLVTDISKYGNQYTDINIAKYGSSAGTYYISFKPGEFKTFMNSTNNTITIRDDQNIVLNIPDTDVKFSQFRFKIVDSNGNIKYSATTNADATEDLIAENVIFNCPNATNAVANLYTGIFLVPNASFSNVSDDLGGVSAGWVIANVIRGIGGQEWHNIYKGMPVVDTTFQIKATKNVDNNPATDEKYSGKFSFDLQQKDGENWKTIDSVTNVNSSIVFNNLGKFKTEGTHFYRIVETASALNDVTIDSNPVYVKAVIKKNGNKLIATVTYYSDENYSIAVSNPSFNNKTVTPETVDIEGNKKWNDNNNQDGKRPESITVNLFANGSKIKSTTVTEADGWSYAFDNLDKYADGNEITYTVTEDAVTDYTTSINGYNITNSYTPGKTSVTVTKAWDDNNNQDGKRPDEIKVQLKADGENSGAEVSLNEGNSWTYTWSDLDQKKAGQDITYTVEEVEPVTGYTTAVSGTAATGFTVTNTHTPEKTSISGTKTWSDADNQDGKRPASITVNLLADGNVYASKTVTAASNWKYNFTDLPKYKAGKEIKYKVEEVAVADYTTEVDGYDIYNTHTPETTSISGTKTWNDANNQDGKRPDSITVRLLADGNVYDSKTVTADSNWTYKFTELPKYAAGKEIVYTVSEDAVPGYITSVNGNNLINTITSVKVSKVDITDHKELAGAHIQILDKDGNIIDEWDSTWEAHEVTGLKTNEQYTLRETVAPDGYTVTSDTTFTLKEDGTVDKDNTQTTVSDDGTLLVEDSKTSVKVSKVDIADGKELEGAHIQVIDEDENIVAEWDSTKEPHVIEGLKTDKKYILRETVAPTGYELTNDTTFVLKADGTVDTEKTTTVSKDGVLLVQDKLATGQSIAVTKKLTTITGDLRAMDQTFYVALYSDEACTQRVSDVKAIEFKNASSSTVVFNENIEVNKDYYIAECSQDGTAQSMGALADGTMYEAKFNNGNKATVKEANGTTTVYFDNVFSSIPDGYYKQGKLTITKKLLGADGNAKKSDNVFYAGIFDDADYTQLSTQVSQNIVKLDLAGGSEVSQVIKIGLDVNKTVTLYVTETDSNGKPVAGTSGFAYKVSVDGSTVTIDEANENASVTITNTENPTTTKTTKTTTEESGNESGSSASSHSMSSSTKAPKTGDDTPIAMYVIILIAAAALIVFGFEKRRRSNRK